MSRRKYSKNKSHAAPRATWEEYGLEDKSYRKRLYTICQFGEYKSLIRQVSHQTCPDIAGHLVKSVTQSKSYEKIEFDLELGRICVGKTDFYGYRRLFYHNLDVALKEKDNTWSDIEQPGGRIDERKG